MALQGVSASPAQQDSVVTILASLERNFEHAVELVKLITDAADMVAGPRPSPVSTKDVPPPVTLIEKLRQADLNINAALAAAKEEIHRLRAGLGMA